LLFKVGDESENILVRDRCSGLLAFMGGMERRKHPCLPTELTPEQWAMAQRFASSLLCSNDRYGMPAAGVIRRRWAGLEPPAPLDTLVESVITKQMVPLWYAWIEYRNKVGFGNPPYLDSFTDPLDCWQAIVEFSTGAYGYSTRKSEEECEAILKTVIKDARFFDRGQQLIEEQVWRMENDDWVGNGTFSSTFLYLTLLPWVRAGKPVKDSWARLIVFEDSNDCREIIQTLNPQQREQMTLTILNEVKADSACDVLESVVNLLPLFDSKAVAVRLSECAQEHKANLNDWGTRGKKILKAIKEFAAKY
jgi:hypothetical protein